MWLIFRNAQHSDVSSRQIHLRYDRALIHNSCNPVTARTCTCTWPCKILLHTVDKKSSVAIHTQRSFVDQWLDRFSWQSYERLQCRITADGSIHSDEKGNLTMPTESLYNLRPWVMKGDSWIFVCVFVCVFSSLVTSFSLLPYSFCTAWREQLISCPSLQDQLFRKSLLHVYKSIRKLRTFLVIGHTQRHAPLANRNKLHTNVHTHRPDPHAEFQPPLAITWLPKHEISVDRPTDRPTTQQSEL